MPFLKEKNPDSEQLQGAAQREPYQFSRVVKRVIRRDGDSGFRRRYKKFGFLSKGGSAKNIYTKFY